MTKSTDTQELELGEILRRHHHLPTAEDIKNVWEKTPTNVIDTATAIKAIEQNYILKSKVLEAIGEDEIDKSGTGTRFIFQYERNHLRHQIKSALGLEEEK